MRYLGRTAKIPPAGWRLHSFADTWIAATHEADLNGPFVFKPTTVRVEDTELRTMRASFARYQEDPGPERVIAGVFWSLWFLGPGGTFTRRAARTELVNLSKEGTRFQ